MNKNEKWQNNKDFSRIGDVKISEDTRATLEQGMAAHFLCGNYDGAKLGLNMLGKVDTQTNIIEALQAQGNALNSIMDKIGMNKK